MLIFFLIFILAIAVTTTYALFSGIGWVPTRQADIDRFLRLADVGSKEKVYDLGCGDGRLVISASKLGAEAIGLEISILLYIGAVLRKFFSGSKAKIKFGDFWRVDLRQADVVYLFLIPRVYSRLKNKLEKELKPGAKVVVLVWPIPGWQPSVVDKIIGRPTLYLYVR
ncbi:MAG: SAM-dependent methyltransferase [Patescibacteria group bacterium]